MHKKAALLAVLLLVSTFSFAAEDAKNKAQQDQAGGQDARAAQMEKLGALRGRVMYKLSELTKLVDGNQNGAQGVYNTVYAVYNKISQNCNKRIQEENAKPQEMRNQVLIENMSKKSQLNGEMWNDFLGNEWPSYGKLMNEQSVATSSLNQIFNSLASLEMAWSSSGIDVGVIISAIAAVEKRADEAKERATKILGDLSANVNQWEEFARQ